MSHLCGSAEAASLRPVRREVPHRGAAPTRVLPANSPGRDRRKQHRSPPRAVPLATAVNDAALERCARCVTHARDDARAKVRKSPDDGVPDDAAEICGRVPLTRRAGCTTSGRPTSDAHS